MWSRKGFIYSDKNCQGLLSGPESKLCSRTFIEISNISLSTNTGWFQSCFLFGAVPLLFLSLTVAGYYLDISRHSPKLRDALCQQLNGILDRGTVLKDVPCPYVVYRHSCTHTAHKATDWAISGFKLGIVRTAKPWDETDVQITVLLTKLYFLAINVFMLWYRFSTSKWWLRLFIKAVNATLNWAFYWIIENKAHFLIQWYESRFW